MNQVQTDLLRDSVWFLKAIHRYLLEQYAEKSEGATILSLPNSKGKAEQEVDVDQPAEEEERTYLNVSHFRPSEAAEISIAGLVKQCECLVERIEQEVPVGLEMAKAAVGVEQEEECSYLDMSGSNTPKANISKSSASIVREEEDARMEDARMEDENSYELTTDQILYDECQQEVSCETESLHSARESTADSPVNESQCPFGGLPASHLRLQHSAKHGTLFRQEKRLFFDQFKKYYVGLIGKWLLLYNSHNDLKPCQTILIKAIKLDLNLNEHINEKHLFQIITHTDSKVHFLSPSFQELNEWIVAIENNLIETKPDRQPEGNVARDRKLPMLPCPPVSSKEETNSHGMSQEDGIYEEPSLYLKAEKETRAEELFSSYDIPRPCVVKSTTSEAVDCQIKPPCSTQTNKRSDLQIKNLETTGAPTVTPVKSWLKNKFNRSPQESPEGKGPSKKALKKLSFEELMPAEMPAEPKSPTTGPIKQAATQPPSPKFSLSTVPANKGTKINMIISQLEANGQLNLLSKRLAETNKRFTWVAEGVAD